VVCSLRYAKQGAPEGYAFGQAIVRSAARLTYTQLAQGDVPQPVVPMLQQLWRWLDERQPERGRRGLLERAAAEPRLVAGAEGGWSLDWVAPGRANELVEEAMLAANRAAAAQLTLLGAGMLFRHQQGLDAQRWQHTRDWLAAHGIDAPAAPMLADLRRLLAAAAASPLQPQVEYRVLRALTPALYDELQSSHFSLGFFAYTHFTSPIRRYADLLVHRLLLGQPADADAALSEHLSARASAARQAGRFVWQRLKRRAVWRSGAHEHDAQVVSFGAKGLKVALAGWEVSAAVAADALAAAGWQWREADAAWRRDDDALDLGSRLRVRLVALHDDGPRCELQARPSG
jgi:ribonuclease R